ncbi:hypothetical protein [Paludibacterium purpuratum]|nr:hypothetical protein [Paludibacterium purpuratum]
MRVLLLAETLARQLNEIGHVQDRASAGQEIVHTLAWIDALLASHELAPIGIGGQLKKERSACAEDRQRNVESLAHRQPIVTAMCSDGAAGAARTSALADFNDMLQKVRNELIGTEVDMALESCVSEADMQWADIYAAIQGMDRQIAEIHGQRFSGKLVTGSNLDKSSDAVSNICIQTQHHFADGIEPVLTQLDARVAWADGIAAAGAELEALCADIPHGTSAERRLAWEAQLRQWADKFDSLPLPNGSGKLGEMLGPRLGQALTALSSVTTDSEARRLQGFATRDLPWCDRALAALDQCSASLFNPGGVLDEYVRLVPEKGVARKSHEKLGKHGMKMAEYNAHVAIENSAMEGVISRRLNEFNRKNQDRSKTATASIASIGLKGHNDYIAHLKEHIREDGTKNLLDRSYDVLIDSVERARGCAKRLCRHLILPTDNRGSVLYDKVESLDKAVQETLEKQRQFTGMRLLSRHREILRELYVPHLQRYAYFDHPDYTLLKNNMQETASSARFQETVARQIELHGSPLYFSPTTPRFVGLVGPLASLGTRTDAQAT